MHVTTRRTAESTATALMGLGEVTAWPEGDELDSRIKAHILLAVVTGFVCVLSPISKFIPVHLYTPARLTSMPAAARRCPQTEMPAQGATGP